MLNRKNIENITALTPLQEGMLFHTLDSPDRLAYVEQLRMRLAGELDPALFEKSWEILCDRHEMLRSVFIHDAAKDPIRVVLKKGKNPVSIHPGPEAGADAAESISALAAQDRAAMDLTRRETPFRIRLFCHDEQTSTIIWTFHHLLLDGWSVAVLQEELKEAYNALANGRSPALPPPPLFSDYLKFCRNTDPALDFWEKRLDGYERPTPIPVRQQMEEGFERAEAVRFLGRDRSADLRQRARSLSVSPGALVRTAWALVLGGLHEVRDTVFLATVSGRPEELAGVERMVGLFINALPQRIFWDENTRAGDLVKAVQARHGEESAHPHASLAAIQAKSQLGRALADHIFVFENYPETKETDSPWQITESELFEHTHYDFELQVFPDEDIWLRARWNSRRHDAMDVETLLDRLIAVTDAFDAEKTADQLAGLDKREPLAVCLAATFTPDLLALSVQYWLRAFGFSPSLEDAGYKRFLAALRDPESLISKSRGPVLLPFRFADLKKDLGGNARPGEILAEALAQSPAPGPFVVALLPASGDNSEAAVAWEELCARLAEDNRIIFLDLREVPPHAGTGPVHDPVRERLGDLPFTDAFFGYAGAAMARTLVAWKRPPFKVIALDFDNTLWQGICGEAGPRGVSVTPGHRFFQQFLKKKAAEGFLLAGLSKNNEADALAVFREHPDMVLKESDLVDWRICWEPKPEGLASLARDLNLGADSFIFLDDSPAECSQMMSRMPEVLTLQMPADPAHIPAFLERTWAFDRVRVTHEDRKRPAMYRAERKRRELARQSGREDFLRELGLKVFMAPVTPAQVERSAQLSRRTNQFHCNPERMSDERARSLMADSCQEFFALHVADRFGVYGQTGLVRCRRQNDSLFVDNFLLSCRVLGRGVENTVLALLAKHCLESKCRRLVFAFKKTDRNQPARDFLLSSGGVEQDSGWVFDPHQVAAIPPFVQVFRQHPETGEAQGDTALSEDLPKSAPQAAEPASAGISFAPLQVNSLRLSHRADLLPLAAGKPGDWEAMVRSEGENPGKKQAGPRHFVAPKEGTEAALAGIWQEILDNGGIGREDDFFACGGHSLSATRLASLIAAVFGVMLRLETLFTNPRLRDMALAIEGARGNYHPIPANSDAPRLSPAQERMAFLQALHPEDTAYNLAAAWWLSGGPDVAALEKTLRFLAGRHENLRTLYLREDGEVRPRLAATPFAMEFMDAAGDPEDDPAAEERALSRMRALARQPFDLSQEPPFRALYVKTAENEGLFALVFHHIAIDGHGFGVLRREMAEAYQAFCQGRSPEFTQSLLRPGDYGAWMQARLDSGDMAEDLQYWRSRLAGGPRPLDLPLDAPRPAVRRGRAGRVSARLPEEDAKRLLSCAETLNVTPFAFLVTVLKALLFFDTGQSDISCGTVVSGRNHPDTEDFVGFVANTLVLRSHVEPDAAFTELVAAVAAGVRQALDHGEYPFDRLVREMQLPPDTSRSPLFDVMGVLQEEATTSLLPGVESTDIPMDPVHTAFDLVFEWVLGKDLGVALTYDADLFSKNRMEAMAGHFLNLARNAALAPETPVSRLSRLSAEKRRRVLLDFRGPRLAFAAGKNLAQAFQETVKKFGDRPVFQDEHRMVSYRELEKEAAALAVRLAGEEGVRPGDVVAVRADRSLELVRGLLAVLMAGGVYLPLEPTLPETRVADLLKQAGSALILSDTGTAINGARVLPLHAGDAGRGAPSVQLPSPSGDAPAYLIFTSGSTGAPKGVLCRHAGFLNMIEDQIRVFGVSPEDRVLLFASPAFDASLSEIFMALLAGAALVPADRERIAKIGAFPDFLSSRGVSVATLPPVYLRQLKHLPDCLRVLITAGEAADPELARFHAGRREYFNAYGPTEYSVCTSIHKASPHEAYTLGVPIGKPIANTRVYILGPGDQPQPEGVPGEICVAGTGLALGYLGREDLTRAAFVADPFVPGEKMYRTGDRGRWDPNGEIGFLGRADDQVKVRGVRVEPGEIEAALCRHPGVRDAAVVLRERDGEKLLAAWITGPQALESENLRLWLLERLPEPMVPTRIFFTRALPLNTSGKVDKAALELPAPGTEKEPDRQSWLPPEAAAMAAACRKILGRTPAPDADLFSEGLDSLRAMGLLHLLEKETGFSFSLMDLYRLRTLRALLRKAKGGAETGALRPLILLPPMPGLGLVYHPLANAFDDVFVQAPDFEGLDALTAEVRALASRMPEGLRPILGGYSGGGNLAVRVAARLEKEGVCFPELILVDAWRRKQAGPAGLREREQLAQAYINRLAPPAADGGNGNLKKRALNYLETLDGSADMHPVSGRVHLLYSEDSEEAGLPRQWDRNWATVARGGCFPYEGSGPHESMLEPAHLPANIKALKRILAVVGTKPAADS